MVPYTHTHTHKYTYMFKKWNKQKSTVKILYYNKRQIKKKIPCRILTNYYQLS